MYVNDDTLYKKFLKQESSYFDEVSTKPNNVHLCEAKFSHQINIVDNLY